MSDMKMIGAHDRAKQAKAALVRLRREVEAALPPHFWKAYEIPSAISEIAECMGVLRGIMEVLDKRMPADMPGRESFAQELQLYASYHEVMR